MTTKANFGKANLGTAPGTVAHALVTHTCLKCGRDATTTVGCVPYCAKCKAAFTRTMDQRRREHPERFTWGGAG